MYLTARPLPAVMPDKGAPSAYAPPKTPNANPVLPSDIPMFMRRTLSTGSIATLQHIAKIAVKIAPKALRLAKIYK